MGLGQVCGGGGLEVTLEERAELRTAAQETEACPRERSANQLVGSQEEEVMRERRGKAVKSPRTGD